MPNPRPHEPSPTGRLVPTALRQFLDTEAAGGIVLLVAASIALMWANSPWPGSYQSAWGAEVLGEDMRHWVNDGLMTLFFLVVGLEIKRELVHGELRDPRVAALPAVAAAGGMAVPALVFLAVTAGSGASRGWGIPMATDIAFAVGVLAVLGGRAPSSLKLFLLTLAVVDDIGAIVVIALFYAGGVELGWLAVASATAAVLMALSRWASLPLGLWLAVGVGLWLATTASGIHPTVAGVALGLLTPARPGGPDRASPAERLEHLLHPWTSFAVVPLFALANAGVRVGTALEGGTALRVAVGVAAGLVAGKLAGIAGASWLAVRLGAGRLPDGATWPHVAGVAALGGIGFTVSLFITELAFGAGPVQDGAKLGVLAGSTVAAALGWLVLWRADSRRRPAHRSEADAR